MLTPTFHFKILEEFFDTFNHQSLILCDKIWNLCHHEEKVEIEVDQLMSLCTLDIICGNTIRFYLIKLITNVFQFFYTESAMGCKINAQTKESDYVKSVSRLANNNNFTLNNFLEHSICFISRQYGENGAEKSNETMDGLRQYLQLDLHRGAIQALPAESSFIR